MRGTQHTLARAAALLVLLSSAGLFTLSAQEDGGRAAPPVTTEEPPVWSGRCADCHVEQGWSAIQAPAEGQFDHGLTGFPLKGAHAKVECSACHRRGLDALTSSCSACHKDPHAGQNSQRCEACHTTRDWQVPRGFFVHERTRFPLTGAHAALACEQCHRPARGEPLAATPTECMLCHVRDYQRARPSHVAAMFTSCGLCHTTSSFMGASYTHLSYRLEGAHARASCVECHTGATFAGLAASGNDCLSCHQDDYASTASLPGVPNHPASSFPSDCRLCHQNVDPPVTFNGASQ